MNKKDDSILLSSKHGLNPSLITCPICGESHSIALFGRLEDDAEAPRTVEEDLCDKCKKEYITLMEAEEDRKLTGRCGYIKREAVKEAFRSYDRLLILPEDFNELVDAAHNV